MKGDLVSLEPLIESDYELIARWSSMVAGVYGQGTPVFVSTAELKRDLDGDGDGTSGVLMVVAADGRRIGVLSWSTLAYPDSYTGAIRIGDPELWTQGYGMEANILLLNYLFHERNAHRIHMPVGLYNRQMVQMAVQGVFVLEGILRDFFYLDGKYHDAAVYSVLRDEYYALGRLAPGVGIIQDLIPEAEKKEAVAMAHRALDRADNAPKAWV
jgi:RimJ/RimL family protein N-acetyltransferase